MDPPLLKLFSYLSLGSNFGSLELCQFVKHGSTTLKNYLAISFWGVTWAPDRPEGCPQSSIVFPFLDRAVFIMRYWFVRKKASIT